MAAHAARAVSLPFGGGGGWGEGWGGVWRGYSGVWRGYSRRYGEGIAGGKERVQPERVGGVATGPSTRHLSRTPWLHPLHTSG